MAGKLFLITAPSGAGKTTLVAKLLTDCPLKGQLFRPCTYTTRPMSENEKQGVDYHFIEEQEFLVKIQEGFFIEWSTHYGYYYGSPRSLLDELEKGYHVLLIVDRKGAVVIGIGVSDYAKIAERLKERARETEEQRAFRVEQGRAEQQQEIQCPLYDYYILNDDLPTAYAHLERIIIKIVAEDGAGAGKEFLKK